MRRQRELRTQARIILRSLTGCLALNPTGGETFQLSVAPGPEGQAEFMSQIRSIFGLADGDSVQLTFGCKVPGSGMCLAGSTSRVGLHSPHLTAPASLKLLCLPL